MGVGVFLHHDFLRHDALFDIMTCLGRHDELLDVMTNFWTS